LNIADVAKEIPALFGAEGLATGAIQSWNCMLSGLAQMRLRFAEGQFERL